VDSVTHEVSAGDLSKKYNENTFSPIDSEVIKACDHLAAYISIGIARRYLESPEECA
jgi:putative hydrolase of HD superfamily